MLEDLWKTTNKTVADWVYLRIWIQKIKVTKIFILLLFPSLLIGRKTEDVEVVYELKKNVPYLDENGSINSYRKKRCKLDLYYPRSEKAFPTVVWFHGGGLRSGEKSIPKQLR